MNAQPKLAPAEQQILDTLVRWMADPVAFVREAFGVEPDAWQAKALRAYASQRRVAMKACKGPGKTTVIAWAIWHFMLHENANIIALSLSGATLRTNLWKEVSKWYGRCELLRQEFTVGTRQITKSGTQGNTWFCHARTWSKSEDEETAAQSLQGLHSAWSMVVLDESGGMPEAVMVAAEGVLAEVKTEGGRSVILQAGNPTLLSGPLWRACSRDASLWTVIEITGDPDDPDRSPRISIEWAREQIQKYGRDHPWVLVNVLGRFPPASFNALIGPDEVRAACGRHLRAEQYEFAAKVIGVDVARFGDDASVAWPRQGQAAFDAVVLRHADSSEGGGRVTQMEINWDADAVAIDATGGYGSGWIDYRRLIGRGSLEVQFSGKPSDPKFYNKRSEMYWKMCEWIKKGGALPPIPEGAPPDHPCLLLIEDLTETNYSFKADKIIIEEKEHIKDRLGRSPDYGDALGCTFAFEVSPRVRDPLAGIDTPGSVHHALREYDVLADG